MHTVARSFLRFCTEYFTTSLSILSRLLYVTRYGVKVLRRRRTRLFSIRTLVHLYTYTLDGSVRRRGKKSARNTGRGTKLVAFFFFFAIFIYLQLVCCSYRPRENRVATAGWPGRGEVFFGTSIRAGAEGRKEAVDPWETSFDRHYIKYILYTVCSIKSPFIASFVSMRETCESSRL